MKKAELVETITKLYGKADELKALLNQADDLAREIFNGLEELPSEVTEIEDDEKEEE